MDKVAAMLSYSPEPMYTPTLPPNRACPVLWRGDPLHAHSAHSAEPRKTLSKGAEMRQDPATKAADSNGGRSIHSQCRKCRAAVQKVQKQ